MSENETSGQGQINPAIIVIFGASGDLTQRKLVPALYTLYVEGRLGDQFAIVGVARSKLGAGHSDDDATGFREHLRASTLKNAARRRRSGPMGRVRRAPLLLPRRVR